MARGLLAGDTDYSHQTFDDMIGDLREWVMSLDETTQTLTTGLQKLETNGYWKKVDFDVQATLSYAIRFFITSRIEIAEIVETLQNEVEENHIARIRNLAHTAIRLDINIGKVWHQYPWNQQKEYGKPNFSIVELIYSESRSMAVDMIDMDNLAARLEILSA